MDWVELGRALQAAREAAGLTQREIAQRLDVGLSTVQGVERGRALKKVSPLIRAYAAEVGWPRGSVERVLRGEPPLGTEPEEAAPSTPEQAEPIASVADGKLPVRVVDDLNSEGVLLDTDVIDLPGGAQAIVVVKGRVRGTPQEIQVALEAWRRVQPHLRELLEEPPTPAGT
ncbi:helix-turn-helix domain-containing protein [Streptomyces sp. NPDC008125]|uniref:helix-turn-helix domain-containing protein n=1 Tax=Streptomyces sp. NPDC008125 TaxID=3364811 RepID=UPI0036E0C64A